MATTVSTPQTRTTPKGDGNGSGPPVGLIVAPILLCVLIAALIFLWIKYREHKKRIQEQVLERMLRRNQGETESIPSATTPGANSTHNSESESNKPLIPPRYPSDEPVPSPGSASEIAEFTDESEKGQNLDPIEERDDNSDHRVRSDRHAQFAAPRQPMLQEDRSESAEEQDPSESGGEPEEEPQPFRDRRNDSGYRSERTRPSYHERYQLQLRPLQIDCHSNYSDDSEETVPKEVVPSAYLPVEPRSGQNLQRLHPQRMDYQGSTYSDISDQSETQLKMPVEPEIPRSSRPGQQSFDYTRCETKDSDEDEDNDDGSDHYGDLAQKGKRLQNNVQEDSEDDSYSKKYIV